MVKIMPSGGGVYQDSGEPSMVLRRVRTLLPGKIHRLVHLRQHDRRQQGDRAADGDERPLGQHGMDL